MLGSKGDCQEFGFGHKVWGIHETFKRKQVSVSWAQWLVLGWRKQIWGSPVCRGYVKRGTSLKEIPEKERTEEEKVIQCWAPGIKHSEISRGTWTANKKVPGERADHWAGWCREVSELWTDNGHWLSSVVQVAGNLEVGSGKEIQWGWGGTGREDVENSISLYLNTNMIFIHYFICQFLETSQELHTVSLHIYNELILNPNRLEPNHTQIPIWLLHRAYCWY